MPPDPQAPASAPELIDLSEAELVALMKASDGQTLVFATTTRGAKLNWRECRWALPLLAEWRGLTFQDGAGI